MEEVELIAGVLSVPMTVGIGQDEDQKSLDVGVDVPLAPLDLRARIKARDPATSRRMTCKVYAGLGLAWVVPVSLPKVTQ